MDVLLLAASGGVGGFLPVQDFVKSSHTMRFALGLSLSLLSLSIIEVAPSKWLAALDGNESSHVLNSNGHLTVMGVYVMVLWILVLEIIVVIPGSIGAQIFHFFSHRRDREDADDKKYNKRWKAAPWWIRYSWKFALLILSMAYGILLAPLLRMGLRKAQQLLPTNDTGLSMTNHCSSQDGGRHGLKISPHSRLHAVSTLSISTLLGAIGGVLTALFVFKASGSLVIRLHDEETHVLASMVSWLCAIGLLTSSLLNGFGSVSFPYTCMSGLFLEPIGPEVLANAEMELRRTTKSLETKIAELQSDSFNSSGSSDPSITRRRSTLGKMTFTDYNSDESLRRKQVLQQEIDFLDVLIGELKEDILEMRNSQEQGASARTSWGKVRSYVGFLFSAILLIRLYTATMSVVCESIGPVQQQDDPITTFLLWLTGHNLVENADYDTLSQGISLLLTAVLGVSQMRTFLRTASTVNRRVTSMYRRCCDQQSSLSDQRMKNSSLYMIYSHVLAALTGCYCLSCVVLTKMNLPIQYRSSFRGALGGMEYTIRAPVVNLFFCISAGFSVMVLSLLFGIQRQNTKRYGNVENVILGGVSDVC